MSAIELQVDLQKAIDTRDVVRAIDPRSKKPYVLIQEEVYDQLRKLAYDDSAWTKEECDLLAEEAGELLDRYQP